MIITPNNFRVLFIPTVCAALVSGMPEGGANESFHVIAPMTTIRADALDNRPAVCSISSIQQTVEQLESELDMKLMIAQALNPEKRKDKCCWALGFYDAQGYTLWLHMREDGMVIGNKSKREWWPDHVKRDIQDDFASRLPVPWMILKERESQKECDITYLEWNNTQKCWRISSFSESKFESISEPSPGKN